MDCTFCKIINKDLPSYTIYEDEIVLVFLSIDPLSNGHTLIIPKKHYLDITDIPIDTLAHINSVAKNIYNLLKEKLNFDGLKVVQNNGTIQEIKHYHLHLVPHFKNTTKKTLSEVYEILKS